MEKKQLIYLRLITVLLAVMLLALIVLTVFLGRTVRTVESFSPQINSILSNIDAVSESLEQADTEAILRAANELSVNLQEVDWSAIDTLTEDAQKSLTLAAEALEKTIEVIDALDIPTLNEAITDLRTVVEPLANLVGRFR